MKRNMFRDGISALGERPVFSIVLSVVFLIAAVIESISFILVLPILEFMVDANSDGNLASVIKIVFRFFEIQYTLFNALGIFLLAMAIKFFIVVFRDYLKSELCNNFRRKWLISISNYISDLDFREFVKKRNGDVISDALKQTELAVLFLMQFIELLVSSSSVIALICILYIANPDAGLVIIIFGVSLLFLAKSKIYFKSKMIGSEEVNLNRDISGVFTELVSHMKEIRLNGFLSLFLGQIRKKSKRLKSILIKWDTLTAAVVPGIELTLAAGFSAFVFYVAVEYGADYLRAQIPVLAVMVIVAHRLFQRSSRLFVNYVSVGKYHPAFLAVDSYRSMNPLMSRTGVDYALSDPKPLPDSWLEGPIDFDRVSLKGRDGTCIIDDCSFQIPQASVIGLRGDSGSGKSSLIDCMVGFVTPDKGRVLYAGHALEDRLAHRILNHVAVVNQDVSLFHGTLRDNLVGGYHPVEDSKILEHLAGLGLKDIVEALPDGLDADVGTRGGLFSGGQIQRLAICRALVRTPSILVLDEATNALDSKAEQVTLHYLTRVMSGRTIIIISHNELALDFCTKVFEIRNKNVRSVR